MHNGLQSRSCSHPLQLNQQSYLGTVAPIYTSTEQDLQNENDESEIVAFLSSWSRQAMQTTSQWENGMDLSKADVPGLYLVYNLVCKLWTSHL